MSLAMIVAFVALMIAVVPVAHALVIASGVALLWEGQMPLLLVAQQMFQQTQSFPMLALPFFILAGTLIMEASWARSCCASPARSCSGCAAARSPPPWSARWCSAACPAARWPTPARSAPC
jgi:hypothetical protein